MIRSYEEFRAIVLSWLLATYGTTPYEQREKTFRQIEKLFVSLGLDELPEVNRGRLPE